MTFLTVLTEQYLMEAIIDNVMKAHPDVDPSIIKHYDNQSVPEHAKQHLDWVIRQHKKGNITPDDAHTLKPYLSSYTKYKDKIGENLNKFDVQGLRDSVKRFVNSTTDHNTNVGNEKIIHEDDDIIIKQHKGFEAAANMGKLPENNPYHSELGGHAKWCISLRGGHNKSYLSTYTDGGRHPVYSIQNKHTGRKYALVANPNERNPEFRDEHDGRPNMDSFLTDNPSVLHTKPGKFLQAHFSAAKDFADTFHGHDIKTLSEGQIRSLYDEHEGDYPVTSLLMKQKNAPADLLEKHYEDHKHANGTSTSEFTSVSNKNFPKSVVDRVVEHGTTHAGDHLADMSMHANLSSDNIDKITKYAKETGDVWQVRLLVNNPNITLTTKQKHNLIDVSPHETSALLAKEKDPHIIDRIVRGTDNAFRKNYMHVANNKNILPSTYNHLLNHVGGDDFSGEYKKSLQEHPLAKTHAYQVLIDSSNNGKEALNHDVKNHLMRTTAFTKDQQQHLLDTYQRNGKALATKKDATSDDHIRKNTSHVTLQSLYANPHLHPDIVNQMYTHAKQFDHSAGPQYHTRLRFVNNAHKLSDENFKDLMSTQYGANRVAQVMDFKANPHMVDKLKPHYVSPGAWSDNKTLTSEHISDLYHGGNISDSDALRLPNTDDNIVKKIAVRNKVLAAKALDRPNVSPDTMDAIVKAHFKNKPVGVMKKMINHTSASTKAMGSIIDSLRPTPGEFTSNSTSKFRKDTVHELYKNNDKLTNKQFDQVMSMPMHAKTIKNAIKDGVSDKHIKLMMQHNPKEFQQWTGDMKKTGSELKPHPGMFEAIMKSPSVGKETLTHMLENKDKFIPKGQENYVARRLSEAQGQLSLPFGQGKKK